MPFLLGLGEKIALSLTLDLVKASAAVVRRRFGTSEAKRALRAAIAAAIEEALGACELPPAERGHYEHLFEEFFRREAVVAELAQLLDPRPGVALDAGTLMAEFEAAGF